MPACFILPAPDNERILKPGIKHTAPTSVNKI